ncbi:MAG: hypothetical protein J7K40_12595 [candidate division Zixibacteria bacterium]|nr:hypothetical protein [candidate division Zixibacteria bacterium]
MANCRNKKLIGPYLDGQLGECQWLDEHIVECPECMAEFEMIQRIAHVAKRADFAPPESNYWKTFPNRVSARIAARQRPRFHIRVLENVLSNKFLTRLAAPAAVVFVGMFIFIINSYLGDITPDVPDIINAPAVSVIDNSFNVPSAPLNAIEKLLVQDSQPPARIETAAIEEDVSNRMMAMSYADNKPSTDDSDEINAIGTEYAIKDFSSYDINSSTSSISRQSNIGLNDLAWTELTRIKNFCNINLNNFNTDQVIKYQIMAGSNSSLVPLASHREAISKYFAPRISSTRDIDNHSISSSWGYASGDNNNYDLERLHHLRLELELSREK